MEDEKGPIHFDFFGVLCILIKTLVIFLLIELFFISIHGALYRILVSNLDNFTLFDAIYTHPVFVMLLFSFVLSIVNATYKDEKGVVDADTIVILPLLGIIIYLLLAWVPLILMEIFFELDFFANVYSVQTVAFVYLGMNLILLVISRDEKLSKFYGGKYNELRINPSTNTCSIKYSEKGANKKYVSPEETKSTSYNAKGSKDFENKKEDTEKIDEIFYDNSLYWRRTKLAGVTFDNRQNYIKKLSGGERIKFVHEEDCEEDVFAVAVYHKNTKLGYLRRPINKRIANDLDHNIDYIAYITEITGRDKKSLGVNIKYVPKEDI